MRNKPSKSEAWRITKLCDHLLGDDICMVEPAGSQTFAPSPARIKELALEKRRQAINGSEDKNMKKTSVHVIVAVALVALLSVTAFAALGGVEYLKSIFGESTQLIQEQISTPRITASADGRDMTLEAMVTDGYVTNLVVSLTGTEPSGNNLFSVADADAVSVGYFKLEEFSTSQKTFFMVDVVSEKRFEEKQLTIALDKAVAPISLSFQLENQLDNAVVTFPSGAMSGETALKELQISPMGFLLIGMESNAKGGLPATSILLEYTNGKTELLEAEFAPSDETVSGGGGAVMSANPKQQPLVSTFHGARNPNGELVVRGQFSRIINPHAISIITVNGIAYPVG